MYSYPAVFYGNYAGFNPPATSIAAKQIDSINTLTLSQNVSFSGTTELTQYGPAQYHWKADGPNGRPDRELPPAVGRLAPGAAFTSPPYSLSILVGPGPAG